MNDVNNSQELKAAIGLAQRASADGAAPVNRSISQRPTLQPAQAVAPARGMPLVGHVPVRGDANTGAGLAGQVVSVAPVSRPASAAPAEVRTAQPALTATTAQPAAAGARPAAIASAAAARPAQPVGPEAAGATRQPLHIPERVASTNTLLCGGDLNAALLDIDGVLSMLSDAIVAGTISPRGGRAVLNAVRDALNKIREEAARP